MKQETQVILARIRKNMDETPDEVAKQDLLKLIESLVELFVDEEPKLVDPNVDPEIKGGIFFKAIGRLALAGGEAWMNRRYDDNNPFLKKIEKFFSLEETLVRYSK
jgi:hypothetical protein